MMFGRMRRFHVLGLLARAFVHDDAFHAKWNNRASEEQLDRFSKHRKAYRIHIISTRRGVETQNVCFIETLGVRLLLEGTDSNNAPIKSGDSWGIRTGVTFK